MLQTLVEGVRKRVERLLIAHGLDEDVPIDEEDGQLALQAASIEGRLEKAWGSEPVAEAPDDPSAACSEWFDLRADSSIPGWDRCWRRRRCGGRGWCRSTGRRGRRRGSHGRS